MSLLITNSFGFKSFQVTWTVITSGDPSANAPKNVSFIFVDDSKSIENLNFTLSSVLIRDAAEKAQDKKIAAVKTGFFLFHRLIKLCQNLAWFVI